MESTAQERPLPYVIPGVFANQKDAEAAIKELRERGLMDEDLGLAIPEPERHPSLAQEKHAIEEWRDLS